MPAGRLRVVLVAALVLALLGVGSAFVVDRRQERRSADDDQAAAAAAAQRRIDERAASADNEAEAEGGEGPGGLLDSLLNGLGGGGEAGGLSGAEVLLERCGPALAATLPEDQGPALFGDGKQSAGSPAEQLQRIAAAVQELRGLRFSKVPEPVLLTPEQLSERVGDEVAAELTTDAAAAETRALITLGALPAGSDLAALTEQALSQQVAGFYDPESGELVVRRFDDDDSLDGQTRIILAHEFEHALADQAIGLPEDDGQSPPGAEDADLARLALVEGDASLTMQLYGLAHVALLDQLSGLSGALSSQEDLARLPYYLQRNLTFPYLDGLAFVCSLVAEGGWAAVDRAYDAPPATTAQVLFPERYRAGEAAVDPRDGPAPAGPSWRAAPVRAVGAAELQWLLEAPGGDTGEALDHPNQRVAAWAGGEMRLWTDGDRTAASLAFVQRPGETPLCATVVAWYQAAFPGGQAVEAGGDERLAVDGARQDAVVRCAGAEVRVGMAPDLATARAIAG